MQNSLRAAAGRGSQLLGRVAGALTLVTAAVVAPNAVIALEIDAYLAAATSGVAGEVAGRAYEASRRPDLAERPLQGTTVTLLPQSETLTRRLEDIKRGARDSDPAFRTAVPRMLQAAQDHERAVRAAGGSSLLFNVSAGLDGMFTFPGVPAGPWILLARHETLVPAKGNQISRKDRQMYRIGPTLEAYRSVTLWVREVTVVGGRVQAVELNDRNAWFSGVVEVRAGADR